MILTPSLHVKLWYKKSSGKSGKCHNKNVGQENKKKVIIKSRSGKSGKFRENGCTVCKIPVLT